MMARILRGILFHRAGRQLLVHYDDVKAELTGDFELSFALYLIRDDLFRAIRNIRNLPGNGVSARQALWALLTEIIDRHLLSGTYTTMSGELLQSGQALVDLWVRGYEELVDTGFISQEQASEEYEAFYSRAIEAQHPVARALGDLLPR